MTDELTKALLLEEVASQDVIAEALLASVTRGLPFVQILAESREVTVEVLARYLARTEAPFLRQVAPLVELVEMLPPGLCATLLAIPVRRDAITGTVDVVVVDAADPHPAREIAFHLGAPVRLVRAPLAAIAEALRRLRGSPPPPGARDDEHLYDSRPRSGAPHVAASSDNAVSASKGGTAPLPEPGLRITSSQAMLDALSYHALRPSRLPSSERQAHVMPSASYARRRPSVTPPWGTEVGAPTPESDAPSDPQRSGLGSEIPIPLIRRTYAAVSGGTQRPPPLVDPKNSLGEGYAVDAGHFRQIVELNERSRNAADPGGTSLGPRASPVPSFIPGPPPLPGTGTYHPNAAQIPFADVGGILAALRAAGARDEVLELVLTGARMVARKVALFVVKRGGYLGWACTPEFGERASLQSILVPLESTRVFEEAVRDGLYLGPLRHDEVHAALLHVMHGASRDVAVVPIRVSGKTAVVMLADELGDTMLATRRLEELSRAAGEAFARIVRMRR